MRDVLTKVRGLTKVRTCNLSLAQVFGPLAEGRDREIARQRVVNSPYD